MLLQIRFYFVTLSGRWQAPAAVLPPEGWQRGRGPEGPEDKGHGHSRARRAREWPKHASTRARRARGRAKLSARFGACQCYYMFFTIQPKMGGCSPKKNQKKPVATPKSVNWHWFFLVFFGFFKFPNWHWFFFGFFWFFLVFFGIGFGQNSKLETGFFCFFFGFFWLFLVFFGIGLGQHSKLETGFLGSVGFFWFFLVFFGIFWFFLVFRFRVRISSQKIPKKTKKNQKKTKKTQKKTKKNQSLHQNW